MRPSYITTAVCLFYIVASFWNDAYVEFTWMLYCTVMICTAIERLKD